MPLTRMTDVVARQVLPGQVTRVPVSGTAGETTQQLLATIGAYIPTEVTTAYVAAAGGMAGVPDGLGRRTLLSVAIGVSLVSSFATWIIGHRKARAQATQRKVPLPTASQTLKSGWFEIIAAGIAFFAWASAMPDSWLPWGRNAVWAPALLVFIVSLAIGGFAILLNRDA